MIEPVPSPQTVQTIVNETKRQFIRIIAIAGMVISICWPIGIVLLHLGNPTYSINFFMFLWAASLYIISTKQKYEHIMYWYVVIGAVVINLIINFTPNQVHTVQDNSIVTLVPMVAMFLLSKKRGMAVTILYGLAIIVILLFTSRFAPIKYELMFNIITTLIIATFFLYFYQDTTDKAQILVKKREKELEYVVLQLRDEVRIREEAQLQLKNNITLIEHQKQELQDLNKIMVGRELTMAAMKEKMKQLETGAAH